MNEREIIAKGASYQEAISFTDNTRLASVYLVFGAVLHKNCPLEWVDIHKSRESFLKNLEDPSNPEYQPIPKVTFNFYAGSVPEAQIVKAFEADLEVLNSELSAILEELPVPQRELIQITISKVIARACHEVLLRREELVRFIKRVPRNAKFDQIKSSKCVVRLGKNSSPELRSHFLSKL
jgi:hypothetical protein